MNSTLKRVVALVLDGSLDASLGVIASFVVSYYFETPLSTVAIWIGVIGAYAPDLDGLYFFLTKGLKGSQDLYKHRSGLHYPLLYLPAAGVVLWIVGSYLYPDEALYIMTIFMSASLLHFIHDTFLHGWGIPWLFPIFRKRVTLFHHTRADKRLRRVFIYNIVDLQTIRNDFRDPDWYEIFYSFPPHPWWGVIVSIHIIGAIIIWW